MNCCINIFERRNEWNKHMMRIIIFDFFSALLVKGGKEESRIWEKLNNQQKYFHFFSFYMKTRWRGKYIYLHCRSKNKNTNNILHTQTTYALHCKKNSTFNFRTLFYYIFFYFYKISRSSMYQPCCSTFFATPVIASYLWLAQPKI